MCGIGDESCADDVIFNGFAGVCLHEGDVFVGGGVDNDLGFIFPEELFYAYFIGDITDNCLDGDAGEFFLQFVFDMKERVLRLLDQQQQIRREVA